MIEYNGEKYLTAAEVARRLQISYSTCRNNVLPDLTECRLPGRKSIFYKLAEVEELSQVRVVEKQPLTLMRKAVND